MRLLFALLTIPIVISKKLPDIYWNSTNPLLEIYAAVGDTMDIYCPQYKRNVPVQETEQTIIYRVPEEDYEKCRISSQAEELRRCVRPYDSGRFTASFRTFSPIPGSLGYKPGKTYYFISTSTGDLNGINNDIGGLCASHNLKMIIHVTSRNGDILLHGHRHHHRHHRTSTTTTAAPEPKQWPEVPMWAPFFDKLPQEYTVMSQPNHPIRPQRLLLDAGNDKDAYQIPTEDEHPIEYLIHEIGEPESFFLSSSALTSPTTIFLLILTSLHF